MSPFSSSSSSSSSSNTSSSSSTARFLLLSLVFHLLCTVSIFDIYFTSPVVHPTRRFSSSDALLETDHVAGQMGEGGERRAVQRPADRLVLIVGDGLRADTLFKEHAADMMPHWGRRDLQTAAGSQEEYPWLSALDPEREAGSHGSVPSGPADEPFFAAPFLRDVVLDRGAWGISHTRVPTESRPGHVALIAGMYEDVSAVTKGWKLNPVDFDSLMNVSTHAYTFGSPDILPMFAKGADEGRVDMWMYDESAEDFTKDATHLDLWALHKVEELFSRAKQDPQLDAQLRQKGNVFFLHLLGLDTTGHTFRPHSSEYVGNLMVVDAITRRVEKLFDDFFAEEEEESRTAFVFSADHGMSSKGNHGDGEPDNTRTPLVAWGSGIRGPRSLSELGEKGLDQAQRRIDEAEADSYFRNWKGLEHLWREDVEQADVTTLMATLLSLPLPANSEGRLPLDYLTLSSEESARAMLANALEVLEIYRVKHEQRKARMLRYVPFSGLASKEDFALDDQPGGTQVSVIKQLLLSGQYDESIAESSQLIDLALEGAKYLQTYDWLMLVSTVTAGYLGSILYGIIFLLKHFVLSTADVEAVKQSSRERNGNVGLAIVSPGVILLWGRFWAEQSPATYYAYAGFAGFYWIRVVNERRYLFYAFRLASKSHPREGPSGGPNTTSVLIELAGLVVYTVALLELMVIGYLERFAWTIGFCLLGCVWPLWSLDNIQRTKHEALTLIWGLSALVAAALTLSSVEKDESRPLLALSGIIFVGAGYLVLKKPEWFLSASRTAARRSRDKTLQRDLKLIAAQLGLVAASTVITIASSYSLQQKKGLPLFNQVSGWAVLLASLFIAITSGLRKGRPTSHRLTILILSFASIFILLSLRDEALFFAAYTVAVLLWTKVEGIFVEEKLMKQAREARDKGTISMPRKMGVEEVKMAVRFLFFLHVGFFGIGNVASISSFYLSPVYRLIPIFSPFAMAALLILKIMIPFVILCSVFHFLCTGRPSGRALGEYLPGEEPESDVGEEREEQEVEQETTGRTVSGPQSNGHARPAKPHRIALEMSGPPLFGPHSVGGLGLSSSYGPVLAASIAADVLALNFLFSVQTKGAWLEIGRSITHFAMANLLQVFMFGLSAAAQGMYGSQ